MLVIKFNDLKHDRDWVFNNVTKFSIDENNVINIGFYDNNYVYHEETGEAMEGDIYISQMEPDVKDFVDTKNEVEEE